MFQYMDYPVLVGKINRVVDNFPQSINFWAKEYMKDPVLITERGTRIDIMHYSDASEVNVAELYELDGVHVMMFTSTSKLQID